MPYQNLAKYILPTIAVVLLMLIAAWAFNLPPVSAITDRDDGPAVSTGEGQSLLTDDQIDIVQVSGHGSATASPDLAELSLAVSVTADTVVEARDTAATTLTAVRTALTNNDVDADDIATSYFRIHPNYEYGPDGRDQQGYTVENGLDVTVRDTDEVGTVIDAAVTAGGDHLVFNNLNFAISDTSDLEKEAREAAIDNMQEKAEQMADFSDRELGDLKIISETPIGGNGGPLLERAFAQSTAASFDTPISAGEGAVTVVVYGVYELLE